MKRLQMFTEVSGGRGAGSAWPPAGCITELDDEEARQVVAGGSGRYVLDEQRAVMPEAPAETRDAPPEPEPAPDPEPDAA